ncbi:MAG: MurR/RpiR family transcriptional regulator [Kosmotogaceae bacterium]
MGNKNSFFQSLKDELPYLKPAQHRIAKYISEFPRLVINLTIKELAKETDTAPSTIVDFCKKLGFNGFRSLKINIAQELELIESMRLDFDKVSNTSQNLVQYISENLNHTLPLIPSESINKACKLILRSKIIDIMAFGFDSIAGRDLFMKVKFLGFQANYFENAFMQSVSAAQMTKESCAIAISSSHSSSDLLDSMNYASNAGAKIISVAPPNSKILRKGDVQIPTYSKTKVIPEGGILTRYIQLLVVDSLFLKLLELGKESFLDTYIKFEDLINYKRKGDKGVV